MTSKQLEYLRLIGREHILDEDVEEERDAIWEQLSRDEQDAVNEIVAAFLGVE